MSWRLNLLMPESKQVRVNYHY